MNRHGVRLRYLWDRQEVIATNARGEVLAAAPLAQLILAARRRPALVPKQADAKGNLVESSSYEIEAIRQAVIARAHLRGSAAPRGWKGLLHGKDIQ